MGYGFDGQFSGSNEYGSYSQHCHHGSGYQVNSFALIVVLFILLVIVGATFYY
ncbi:MAG TPA: YjcZ family sporulation protein [Virgibacillus sp.]|nr:YjcZ family sporulation protein [Virgibacillus sp.]